MHVDEYHTKCNLLEPSNQVTKVRESGEHLA